MGREGGIGAEHAAEEDSHLGIVGHLEARADEFRGVGSVRAKEVREDGESDLRLLEMQGLHHSL
jgi:hypothetical protein